MPCLKFRKQRKSSWNILWLSNLPPATIPVYPYTHQYISTDIIMPTSWRAQAEKPEKSRRILSGDNMCPLLEQLQPWVCPDWTGWLCLLNSLLNNICTSLSYCEGRDEFSRSLTTAVLSFLLQSLRTPRKNSQLWSQDDWKHPECQTKKQENCTKPQRDFFLCFTQRPPTITDSWIKLLEFNELLSCSCGKL